MKNIFAAFVVMLASSTYAMTVPNMSVDEVLADGCNTTPPNFSLSDFWNQEMNVLEAWCKYPPITKSDIGGRRKPQAFVHGSANVIHDVKAVKILNGTGENDDTLGISPRTSATFGLYCTDARPLVDAKPGDVVFTLHGWADTCSFMSPILPTIPFFGIDNTDQFIGDEKYPHGIHISTGWNYGRAIDYFTPGGAQSILARGNVSSALSEFSGIVAALNTALISQNQAVLTNDTIKTVLDASSDEVYLELDGVRGIYKESQLENISPDSSIKYYGQMINLSAAITYALGNTPQLTIVKDLILDSGGNALATDFTLRLSGGIYDGSIPRKSEDIMLVTANTAYTLSEDLLKGYTQTKIECKDDITTETLYHPVTLVEGQFVTCTITNDDIAPELTIIKVVTNENGGDMRPDEFTLRLFGGDYYGSALLKSGVLIAVDANTTYTLGEDDMEGYSQTGIVCKDGDTSTDLGHPVTLAEGQSATCTISNIDYISSFYVIPLPRGGTTVFDL